MMAASYLLLPQPVPQTSKAVLALGWYSSSAQVTLSTVWGRRGWHTSAPQHILLSCMQVLNTILSCLLSTCPWETDFSFCITVVFETMAQLCIFVLKIFLRKIRLQWTCAIRSSTSKGALFCSLRKCHIIITIKCEWQGLLLFKKYKTYRNCQKRYGNIKYINIDKLVFLGLKCTFQFCFRLPLGLQKK